MVRSPSSVHAHDEPTESTWRSAFATHATPSLRSEQPELSDGGHESRRLQRAGDAAVRCSAW
jgi:hypothetical protein